MFVPPWVTFFVAACVIAYGSYRLYIGFTTDKDVLEKRKGLYGLPKRTHILFGVLYWLLGAFLIAAGLGYSPMQIG